MTGGVLVALMLAATPAWSHDVSMSSGALIVQGATARYELRMPLYEIPHIAAPEQKLFEQIRITGAKITGARCVPDGERGEYVCTAGYAFDAPVQQLEVECTLPDVTVPNHVHVLRAELNGRREQVVFDRVLTRAMLRFRPPTFLETAAKDAGAGARRALGGAAQILFLVALVLAARSGKELVALAATFLCGQLAAVSLAPLTGWQPATRFVEAAAALSVAYLAVEILLLPRAGARWLVVGLLGTIYGLYFHLFLQTGDYRAWLVMVGAAAVEAAMIALLAVALRQMARLARALRPVQLSASALLVYGVVWFVLRLRG